MPGSSTAPPTRFAARLRARRADTPASATVIHLNNAVAALMPLPCLALAQVPGVDIRRADDVARGGVDPESVPVRRLVRKPRVRLIALTWIPTNGGLIQPAAEAGAIGREGPAAVPPAGGD